jgi:hypothetical protein
MIGDSRIDPLDAFVVVDRARGVGDRRLVDQELQPLHDHEVAEIIARQRREVRFLASRREVIGGDILEVTRTLLLDRRQWS